MKIVKNISLMLVSLILLFNSCQELESDIEPPQEALKSLEGSWKIVSVTRNEVDITEAADFSQFQINFKADNTYSIDNYLPFIVKGQGTWALDDPKYPFKLSFRENSTTEAVNTDLVYPVVQGERQVRLTFSPGCQSNKYEYVLERVSQ